MDIRVTIIEPSPAFGHGLRDILEECSCGFVVTGIYRDIPSFMIDGTKTFDIVLLNPHLIDFDTDICNCFSDYRAHAILIAIPYGHINPDVLEHFDGVLNILDDGPKIARQLKEMLEHFVHGIEDSAESISLSKREKDIIIAIAGGMTNRDIADSLCLSPHTINAARSKIFAKTGVKGISGLTTYAISHHLIKRE